MKPRSILQFVLRGGTPLYIVRMDCCMSTETLMKFGFVKDENNFQLKEIFKNNFKIKEIHIDLLQENPLATPTKPFTLLLRTIEKNAVVVNNGDRLILNKKDKYNTCFVNILISDIAVGYYKISEGYYEFILNIQNIWYRITVFN